MGYANGAIPRSALAPIPGGLLRKDAAAAWNAMVAEARRRSLPVPYPAGPVSSYRPLAAQQHFWDLYKSGRGNPAAVPGTSNHGWGVAVDVQHDGWVTMQNLGPKYGFTHEEGARVGEGWHWSNPQGARAQFPKFAPATPPTLHYGQRGPSVKALQRKLRALGFQSVPIRGPKHGFFGASTVSAVKRFQLRHSLTSDGVCGPSTWGALRRAVH